MATFTETQISDIAEIVGSNSDYLADHLSYYELQITEADKTKVLARVAEWQAIDGNFARFTATESNEGFNLSPDENRRFLVRSITTLLYLPMSMGGGSRLVRA